MIEFQRNQGLYLFIMLLVVVFVFSILSSLCYLSFNRQPCIDFPDGAVHDYGVVDEGEMISHGFMIKNVGGKPLQIKNVKTGCGCAGAKAETNQLQPGETSKITVSYKGRPTRHEEVLQIWLETNDPKKPITQLLLKCKIHLKVFWYPKTASIFCTQAGASVSREIRFLTNSTEKFELGEIRTSSERITACWAKDDEGIKCIIALNPDCPKGNWVDRVILQIAVGAHRSDIIIPVNLMIK